MKKCTILFITLGIILPSYDHTNCISHPSSAREAMDANCSEAINTYVCNYGTYVACRECLSGYSIQFAYFDIADGGDVYVTCVIDPCSAGEYMSNESCLKCPTGGTSLAGTTAITQCYKPASTTSFSDISGSGTITTRQCYYTN